MSQVIVTHDRYQKERDFTKAQEEKIDLTPVPKKWLLSDIHTNPKPIDKIFAVAFAPVLLIWTSVIIGFYLIVAILKYVFKFLGMIFGGNVAKR